jgi:uncharacterized protein (UPF0212 family)
VIKLNVKKIAKSLGLKYVKGEVPGEKNCQKCQSELQLGTDENGYTQAFCPKCKKIVKTVYVPRFSPGIKVESHND